MDSIRIDSGAKRIEVNDNGDFIVLNFGDHNFPNKFFSLLDRVQTTFNGAEEKMRNAQKAYADGSVDQMRVAAQMDLELHSEFAHEVDELFGPDTCKKVFGDIVPGIELIAEFFEALTPFFEDYGKKRAEKLSKYSAKRTGNV